MKKYTMPGSIVNSVSFSLHRHSLVINLRKVRIGKSLGMKYNGGTKWEKVYYIFQAAEQLGVYDTKWYLSK